MKPELLQAGESAKKLMNLDGDQDLFVSFLYNLRQQMTKQKVNNLLKYTINLDHSLLQSIAFHREIFYIQEDLHRVKKNFEKFVEFEPHLKQSQLTPHSTNTAGDRPGKQTAKRVRSQSLAAPDHFQSTQDPVMRKTQPAGAILNSPNVEIAPTTMAHS